MTPTENTAYTTLRQNAARLYRQTRGQVRKLMTWPRYQDITLECGVTLSADMHNRFWWQIAKKGFHEWDTETFAVQFLEPGDVVADVGGHIGVVAAVIAKQVGPGGKVHVFEPDPTNREELGRTMARNQISQVQVHPVALSNQDGSARFVRPDHAWGAFMEKADGSSPLVDRFFTSSKMTHFEVRTARLDTMMSELGEPSPVLLKVDVDGPEVSVMRGAVETLRRCRPAVLVEASMFYADHGDTLADLFDLLQGLGYELYATQRGARMPTLLKKPADLGHNFEERGSAINLFCRIPGTWEDRWQRLWFMQH